MAQVIFTKCSGEMYNESNQAWRKGTSGMKTGLVLEGGALRTIFSSGVCDAMLEAGLTCDYLVGVSAGVTYGTSFISRQPRYNLEVVTTYAGDRRYMGFHNLLDRKNQSYFGLKFAYETIPRELVPFDYDTFEQFPGVVEAVVTNMNTGRAEYLPLAGRGEEHTILLQATCALPLMFPIYHINGIPYMDGGVSDSIPYQRAFDQGCERVVVVLTKTRSYMRKPESLMPLIRKKYKDYPYFCKAMEQRAEQYNQCRKELFRLEEQGKILVIAPEDTMGVSRTERNTEKLRLLWGQGYQMAADRMDEIKSFLGV